MKSRRRVAIVGGGISGLALAFELRRRDESVSVIVLERGYTGNGDSSRNVGRIRAMQLTPALTEFAIAAQRKHANLSDELGSNTLFWRAGYAWVLYEDEEVDRMSDLLPMYRSLGMKPPRLVTGRALRRALPILDGGQPAAAAMIGRDAIGHHDAVLYAYRRACERLGVDVREHVTVTDVRTNGDAVAGVETTAGAIDADIVVNAAGGWASELSAMVGVDIPNVCLRREVFVTEPMRPFMRPAITFYRPMEGWFNQTLRGELVAGATDPNEQPGLNRNSSFGFLGRTSSILLAKAPRLGALRVIRQWAGVYDITPDRLPLVGPTAKLPGFVQMSGYSGRGFMQAPLIAELLAGWLLSGKAPPELHPFAPDRFEGTVTEPSAVTTGDYYAGYAAREPRR
jgi:glycine/D-amino acid oxidase-like deaminating enzyme